MLVVVEVMLESDTVVLVTVEVMLEVDVDK